MNKLLNLSFFKWGIFASIITILILTVLEFPAPLGFETRPQGDVSLLWLLFFLIILITEIAALVLVLKFPKLGAKLGIIAAILNILQVIADQIHLMQPEVATLGYSLLEGTVALISVVLAYFSWRIISSKSMI